MCQGIDPDDLPIGFCVKCDIELFSLDKNNFGIPTCPNCGFVDVDFDFGFREAEIESSEDECKPPHPMTPEYAIRILSAKL